MNEVELVGESTAHSAGSRRLLQLPSPFYIFPVQKAAGELRNDHNRFARAKVHRDATRLDPPSIQSGAIARVKKAKLALKPGNDFFCCRGGPAINHRAAA